MLKVIQLKTLSLAGVFSIVKCINSPSAKSDEYKFAKTSYMNSILAESGTTLDHLISRSRASRDIIANIAMSS